jgi:hypothetical protein
MSSATFLEKLLDGIAVEWTVLGDERLLKRRMLQGGQ